MATALLESHAARIFAEVSPRADGTVEMAAPKLLEALYCVGLDHAAAVATLKALVAEGRLSLHWTPGTGPLGFGGELIHGLQEHVAGLDGSEYDPPDPFDHRLVRVEDFAWLRAETLDPVRQSTNDPRDAWLYQEKLAGKTNGQILFALKRDHAEWYPLETQQAVGRAVDRYCERHGLSLVRRK